jgi:hypothetical protein
MSLVSCCGAVQGVQGVTLGFSDIACRDGEVMFHTPPDIYRVRHAWSDINLFYISSFETGTQAPYMQISPACICTNLDIVQPSNKDQVITRKSKSKNSRHAKAPFPFAKATTRLERPAQISPIEARDVVPKANKQTTRAMYYLHMYSPQQVLSTNSCV